MEYSFGSVLSLYSLDSVDFFEDGLLLSFYFFDNSPLTLSALLLALGERDADVAGADARLATECGTRPVATGVVGVKLRVGV